LSSKSASGRRLRLARRSRVGDWSCGAATSRSFEIGNVAAAVRCVAADSTSDGIRIGRTHTAVVSFECTTWDAILRSRVIEALEATVGPDWQSLVRPIE
jgi:hypothetical protein